MFFGCAAIFLLCFSTPVAAFGAGNIINRTVSGHNWRHGDIEDVLLELFMSKAGKTKFDSLAVKRVYFGNWLRDYSQALDVGGLSKLPKDTIRILLWVLSFLTFGFATGEFEVTEEKLGVYRPEEHIDNPKDYADNEDARKYDPRLRGPVDEAKELAIDPENGMKVYIASEGKGVDTSAGLVREKFKKCIELGRKYGKEGRSGDLYEALRLLGTGLHCIEDYSAHSNYIELALIEMGVDVFPHVGDNTKQNIKGKQIYPLVTGTFGMTDFLHSVVGEVTDKMFQSEVQVLDSKLNEAHANQKANSRLKEILDKVPWSLLGQSDANFSGKADDLQANSTAKEVEQKANVSENKNANPKIEEMRKQATQTAKDIYPILEFHDQIFKAVHEGIDKIPFASTIVENLTGALQIYIFSLLAPFVTPILTQAKEELKAGSAGVLASSEKGQYLVFNDDNCHDPTHSMLSKDHFTNVLNPVAGQIAQDCVRFVVPRIVDAWEDSSKNVDQVIDDILQVFHHPALREQNKVGQQGMFDVVRKWWDSKSRQEQQDLARKLSKEGVKNGDNHEGEDHTGAPGGKGHSHGGCGHSHGKPGGYGGQAAIGAGRDHGRAETQSTGQRKDEGYGGGRRDDDRSSGYGGTTTGGISAGYGDKFGDRYGQTASSGYGSNRGNDDEETTGSSGYGQSGRRASPARDTTSSYGSTTGRRASPERTSGYGQTGRRASPERTTGYGQTGRRASPERTSGYGQTSASSGYGSNRANDEDEVRTGYGGYGQPTTSTSHGRRASPERSSGYGQTARRASPERSAYGQTSRRSNEQERGGTSGYGQTTGTGYGQTTSGYGRGGRDDEDEGRRGGYGGGRRGGDEDEEGRRTGGGGGWFGN
ncbi:Het-C-domain-containing protein [Ascobolus immersus RN42]|uniref:Het-C-domain-containing protein n=1 Tax=Ascobolus immersus RN42 TaxID=1160509 RepID=A0A3N4I8U7_ASCIM|nr:Het-C-domain-containing protein [Ascobolus immersus RN42]